ncbi:carbohydrate-binding module family 20 domain-containing protein [Aliiglaciecola litoralis]|uniref:1,4-alpha-glucan branching enzyme n=1 Tax=Aliiglaciecola litoralis TaxID=582857 RepID=A0ABP3X041_9ALTE
MHCLTSISLPKTPRLAFLDGLRLLLITLLLTCSFSALADAWLDGDPNAIWQRAPGVYKEGNTWYAIVHTQATDTNVKLYGDFTNGQSGAVSMTRTPDGKFWWFKGTDSSFARAPAHGDGYRFLLTRGGQQQSFQDPAARWVTHSNLTSGMSKIYLSDAYQWSSSNWQRPDQNELNIYQLHPLRFTDRNGGSPLAEVLEELNDNGSNDYLSDLGATAIQLLPVNEFAGELSWGYNPSFFYAVESSYGGPDALKAVVDEAHKQGMAVILDLEFNHLGIGDNILYTMNNATYADGDTVWGPLYNFNNDVAKHFLIQNVLYLAREYRIDGFRFDHTNTIHNNNSGYITQAGDGGGWDFLRELYGNIKTEDPNIWFTAEELPDWWGLTADNTGSTVAGSSHAPMDSQWTDTFHDNFKSVLTGGHLDNLWPVFGHFGDGWQDATVYSESHDEVGNTDDRIAKRGRDGKGWEMNQLSLTGTVLARGTPMIFMGQEGGESTQFHIDWWDDRLPLNDYENDAGRQKVLAWYKKMNEIRGADLQSFASADSLVTHIHNNNGVAAFSRDGGKYVVVMNFGPTTWYNYDVGISGTYLEVANTSWSQYNLGGVPVASRGEGVANAISNVHIPAYGAVVLARASTSAAVNFTCNNGTTSWGQNVYVVGNIPQLGSWDTNSAVQLSATSYPTWTGTVNNLPANTSIEWKCIKRDVGAVVWQGGANNSVTTPSSGAVNSTGSF